MKWKYSQGNREKISLFACSSEGWLDINQEILFHLEFSHTTQGINIAFILLQRINLGHKNQQCFKKTPCGSQHGAKIQLLPCKPAQVGKLEKEFEQSSVRAGCAVKVIQHSQQIDPKRLHWFNQNCTFSPWKERAESPHTQSSIPVPTGSCPAGTTKLFQLFFSARRH